MEVRAEEARRRSGCIGERQQEGPLIGLVGLDQILRQGRGAPGVRATQTGLAVVEIQGVKSRAAGSRWDASRAGCPRRSRGNRTFPSASSRSHPPSGWRRPSGWKGWPSGCRCGFPIPADQCSGGTTRERLLRAPWSRSRTCGRCSFRAARCHTISKAACGWESRTDSRSAESSASPCPGGTRCRRRSGRRR